MITSLFVYSQKSNNNFEAETVNLSTNSSSANILPSHFNLSSVTPICLPWNEENFARSLNDNARGQLRITMRILSCLL